MRYTLLFISLFFLACQEEKVPVYSDQDKINFIGTSEDNEDDPEFMFLEKNFLPIQGDTCNYQLQVKVQGKPSNLDRKVCFAVRDSTTPGIGIEFGECIIPAGKLRGTCEVILKRPESNNESICGNQY